MPFRAVLGSFVSILIIGLLSYFLCALILSIVETRLCTARSLFDFLLGLYLLLPFLDLSLTGEKLES